MVLIYTANEGMQKKTHLTVKDITHSPESKAFKGVQEQQKLVILGCF